MARFAFGKNKKRLEEGAKFATLESDSQKSDEKHAKSPSMSNYQHDYIEEHRAKKPASVILDEGTTPWKRYKLANSPFPRYRHSASQTTSEKNELFVMGGLKDGSVYGDTWKIIPQTSPSNDDQIVGYTANAVEVANLNNPPARVGHSSVLCGNAYIIYGGDTVDTDLNGFPDNNFYLFNINNNKYTVPSHVLGKPSGRYGHSIGVVSLNNETSKLYLFGGQLENDVYNDIYYFELNTFKSPKARWNLVEPLNNYKPPPLTNHSMSIYKNKIYVFGGVYNNEKVSKDLWCFDVLVNKWTQVNTAGESPPPVNEHASCIIDDMMFVYGGNDFSGIIYDSMYMLNLRTLTWMKLNKKGLVGGPGARCGHTMTYLPKFHKILILGGDKNDYAGADPDNLEVYDVFNGQDHGTIIYEFDVHLTDYFIETKENASAPSTKMAASAKQNDLKHVTSRSGRGSNTALEDFRTPNASPGKVVSSFATSHLLVQDKFIDVDIPSTTETENCETPNDEDYSDKDHENLVQILPNGHPRKEIRNRGYNGDEMGNERSFGSSPQEAKAIAGNEEYHRVKRLVTELTSQLNELKDSTKLQMRQATEKITSLEQENKFLKERDIHQELEERDSLIYRMKKELGLSTFAINEDKELDLTNASKDGITELMKYKLERLELKNRMMYLEKENVSLNTKLSNFEPFMNNQIVEISDLRKVIKAQEEQIASLTSQLKEQEPLLKSVNDWRNKYSNLKLEFDNFKSIYADDLLEENEEATENGFADEKSVITMGSSRKSKREISSHLESLVTIWTSKQNEINTDNAKQLSNTTDKDMIENLQRQVDDLLKMGKQQELGSEAEIKMLKVELEDKINNLSVLEQNYRDALQSVNNTSKALKLTQDELKSQRLSMEKLQKENNELKLFKRASRRVSSKGQFSNEQSFETNNSPLSPTNQIIVEDDDDDVFSNAHYNMKVKDLEADLFVIKQERDQLQDSVSTLKKELFLAQQSTE